MKVERNKETSKYYLKILHAISKQKPLIQSIKKTKFTDNMNQTPSSIKPFSTPNDIEVHDIFSNMLNSFYKINGNNSFYIKLSIMEEKKREEIFQAIKTFLTLNNFQSNSKILCHIMYLFDIFISKNKSEKLLNSPYQIAIGAVSLTVKFLLGKNCFSRPTIKFLNIFEQENFDNSQVSLAEMSCLKLINYYLHLPSPSLFMELFYINGIIFSNDDIKNKNDYDIYKLSNEILEKIIYSSNIYIKYNPLYLCCCVVSYAREIYKLEKWPESLEKIFNVHFPSFGIIYNQFYNIIMKNQKNKSTEKQISYKKRSSSSIDINNNDVNNETKINNKQSSVTSLITPSYSKQFKTPVKIDEDKKKSNFISKFNKNNHHKKIGPNIIERNVDNDINIIYSNYTNNKSSLFNDREGYFDKNLNKENERYCFSGCKSNMYANKQKKNIFSSIKNLAASDYSNEVTSDNSKNISNFMNNKIKNNLNQKQNNKINDIIFGDFNYNHSNMTNRKKNNIFQNNKQQKLIIIRKPGKNNNLVKSRKSVEDIPINLKKMNN